MNGKAKKMLKKMNRSDKKSKRVFNSLTHIQKGKLRKKFNDNVKLIDIDFLRDFK